MQMEFLKCLFDLHRSFDFSVSTEDQFTFICESKISRIPMETRLGTVQSLITECIQAGLCSWYP